MVLGGAERSVLGVTLLVALDLCIGTCKSIVLNAITDIDVGVDVLMYVVWQRLIDLLVDIAVATSTARWMRGRPS